MADNGEQEETAPRGNEWEVVSLSASAYAAAPDPEQVVSSNDNLSNLGGENEAEMSRAMFMSGHFVFPPTPSQHENLSLESEYNEILQERGGEDDGPNTVAIEGGKSDAEDKENTSIRGPMADEFPGNHVFDDKGDRLPGSGSDLEYYMDSDELQSIYNTTEFSSLHSEATMGRSTTIEEDLRTDDVIQPANHSSDSGLSNFQKPFDKNRADLPCEAWWRRRAVSLYAHAKETNTVWSIFIAAAVMGLVILGNRWQVLCLKWQFSINDEMMGRMLGPLSRFKDLIVGGQRPGSLIRRSPLAKR